MPHDGKFLIDLFQLILDNDCFIPGGAAKQALVWNVKVFTVIMPSLVFFPGRIEKTQTKYRAGNDFVFSWGILSGYTKLYK